MNMMVKIKMLLQHMVESKNLGTHPGAGVFLNMKMISKKDILQF